MLKCERALRRLPCLLFPPACRCRRRRLSARPSRKQLISDPQKKPASTGPTASQQACASQPTFNTGERLCGGKASGSGSFSGSRNGAVSAASIGPVAAAIRRLRAAHDRSHSVKATITNDSGSIQQPDLNGRALPFIDRPSCGAVTFDAAAERLDLEPHWRTHRAARLFFPD